MLASRRKRPSLTSIGINGLPCDYPALEAAGAFTAAIRTPSVQKRYPCYATDDTLLDRANSLAQGISLKALHDSISDWNNGLQAAQIAKFPVKIPFCREFFPVATSALPRRTDIVRPVGMSQRCHQRKCTCVSHTILRSRLVLL